MSQTLRPRTVGEILDLAFRLYRANFKAMTIIAAFLLVPVAVLQALLLLAIGDDLLFGPGSVSSLLANTIGAFVQLGAAGLVTGGASHLLFRHLDGNPTTWQRSLGVTMRRIIPIALTAVATLFISSVGLIFCIAPGVWLWTSFYVAVPALVREEIGPIKAMQRSFELVRPRFWPTLGLGVVAYFLTSLITSAVTWVVTLGSIIPFINTDPGELPDPTALTATVAVGTFVAILILLITTPFLASVATALYVDLLIRTEAFDLEKMISQLDDEESGDNRPPSRPPGARPEDVRGDLPPRPPSVPPPPPPRDDGSDDGFGLDP